MTSSILLQTQKERYRNLQPFTGDLSQDVDEYIEQIGSIGSLTKEPDEVLHILLKVKLSGPAEWWYDNNKDSLGTWSQLRIGFRERFQQPSSFSSPHPHDRHQLTFKEPSQVIKQEQNILHVPVSTSLNVSSTSITSETKKDAENNQLDLFNDNPIESFEDLENKCISEREQGRDSLILVTINDPELNIEQRCTDETDDSDKLKQQDELIIPLDFITDLEDIFESFVESIGSSTADDSSINHVVPQDTQYLWSDKHQPRNLRVFEKVHTSYDWNQYYTKDYDIDHLPSTIIQSYQFHTFHPNLNNKTKTPSYNLTMCDDTPDFSILKFHAGPPYEDTAFKIVSKEWNYSFHYEFRCYFPTGIVQLWIYFRKWKYRRSLFFLFCFVFFSTNDTSQKNSL